MRAGQMVEVGRMNCVEAPVPEPGPSQVLVRSEMASICGSDLHLVCMGAGLHAAPPMPVGYPGHESIGEIVESNVDGLEAGTAVLCFPNVPVAQGFAEYQQVGGSYVLPLPQAAVPRAHLLMAQQLGTVIYALGQCPHDVAGETVVVLGQGSAGLFFTYLLKRAGAERVIVSDLSPQRLAVSRAYGADVTLDPATDDVRAAVADLTGGKGADYLVEAVGRAETFLLTVDLVRIGAELLWFGLPSVDSHIEINFAKFFRKKLRAACTYGAQDEPGAASFRSALDLISSAQIDVGPLLSHVFPVERIDEAFQLANEPVEAGATKVSVTFT
jgi:2-desacetyl-2-hydroxyethyl bacteriochlorophyllide A dehydrogenase